MSVRGCSFCLLLRALPVQPRAKREHVRRIIRVDLRALDCPLVGGEHAGLGKAVKTARPPCPATVESVTGHACCGGCVRTRVQRHACRGLLADPHLQFAHGLAHPRGYMCTSVANNHADVLAELLRALLTVLAWCSVSMAQALTARAPSPGRRSPPTRRGAKRLASERRGPDRQVCCAQTAHAVTRIERCLRARTSA